MPKFTITPIRDENCDSVLPEVLATVRTASEAMKMTKRYAARYQYGVAAVDTSTGLIDFGYGFGVPVPDATDD